MIFGEGLGARSDFQTPVRLRSIVKEGSLCRWSPMMVPNLGGGSRQAPEP